MKTTKMLYSVSLQSLMNEVKKQGEREKKCTKTNRKIHTKQRVYRP